MNRLPSLKLILNILLFIFASWFILHALALGGVFLALAYPVWWLFAPRMTVCFLCRAQNDGKFCPLCREVIDENKGIYPKSISSAVLNGGLILIFSIVSMGIVFVESKVFFKLGFPPTPKTVSFIIPTKGQYRLGEMFPMKIEIAGIKTPINAIQADLDFDVSKLEVVDISTEGSMANIFIQKEINNEGGYARLTGGLPNPGFFAEKGIFGTVFFKGKSPGVVKVDFLPTSMVLANDGKGTNVLKELASVSYLILPEEITPEEEQMQKEVILQSMVLGEASGSGQIKFFEEKSILGTEAEEEILTNKKPNLFKIFMEVLEKINRFILGFWGGILGK